MKNSRATAPRSLCVAAGVSFIFVVALSAGAQNTSSRPSPSSAPQTATQPSMPAAANPTSSTLPLTSLAPSGTTPSAGAAAVVTAHPSAAPADGFSERTPRYRLQPGDSFALQFEFSPEFNQSATVQPDGFVSLQSIGDVHVGGLTLPQVSAALKAAYSKVLHNPEIDIVLKDFEKPYYTAGGMVAHPGKFELHGDVTVVEAIAMAGGFTDEAKHSQVLLFRRVSQDLVEAKIINVKKMMASKNVSEDQHLRSGDMIFVPQSMISKIRRFIPSSSLGTNPATW